MNKIAKMPGPDAPVVFTVENQAGVEPADFDYAVCRNAVPIARFRSLTDATAYRQALSGATVPRPWRDVAERLDAVFDTLETMPDWESDVEAFVRVELARQIEAARRIANALAADEETPESPVGDRT